MNETLPLIEITLIASEAYLKDKVTVTSRVLIVFLEDWVLHLDAAPWHCHLFSLPEDNIKDLGD